MISLYVLAADFPSTIVVCVLPGKLSQLAAVLKKSHPEEQAIKITVRYEEENFKETLYFIISLFIT